MKKKLTALGTVIIVGLLILVGCGTDDSDEIIIGGKDFTEQYIMAEMMGILIEENTDLDTSLELNLGSAVLHQSIQSGDVDVYLEYTGTGLMNTGTDLVSDPEEAYNTVSDVFEDLNIQWLDRYGFANTYTLTVTQETADEYGLTNITDLTEVANELTLGGPQGFAEREDGLPGLMEHYDFEFASSTMMAPALMYPALVENEVDVIAGFTTDGQVAAYDLVTLEDDQQFFPPYDAAPLVRNETLEAHPELEEVLNQLAGRIDDATMAELNAQVDMDNLEPADVAREFLIAEGLINED
jgi:glycine betaine/choline ABC-type transport system substrate-binding protein